ncbi:hypothetical protein KOR34_02200 [Posidoniimonas corsicana]|uniref:ParB/Sulfiredoxin domain-containing protein n=1 Tax=Posidoniimonas corsicana TaxID=1938618 RepID=A0A5C5VBE3_9BACT|nr:hypothetical protein [Posidoniimonas corsicana]TWT35330.1 hypothetical protein KOR34_02200 [Posidoniimonas corsicana]
MAKKKVSRKKAASKPAAAPAAFVLDDTADLQADAANPRSISDEGAAGLRSSLKRFGDLSGIVYNRRTGELVCGHQRMSQIRAEYGDQPIEVLDAEAELGIIRVDATHAFTVRVVDWSKGKQRTANVAANNQKTQGRFTEDLSQFLFEVEPEATEELGSAWDELLLVDLVDVGLEDPKNVGVAETYQVVVDCDDEDQQREVHELLSKKGWRCRVLTV